MPWFFDVTKEGATRKYGNGPWNTEAECQEFRDAYATLNPADTVSDVFEAPFNHLRNQSEYPVVVGKIVHGDGQEYVHWTDGVEELLVEE